MSTQPLHRFVRSAWTLLLFQLIAAIAAVGVTAWAAFQVRPLLQQREELAAEIEQSRTAVAALETQKAELERTLSGAREATEQVRNAINAYHAGNFRDAVGYYDAALQLDAENPYVLDLKSYSQFRAGDVEGAIASVNQALTLQPAFVYAYSDLARYLCASRRFDEAASAYDRARAQNADEARRIFQWHMSRDAGGFGRDCSPVLARFAQ